MSAGNDADVVLLEYGYGAGTHAAGDDALDAFIGEPVR